MRVLKNFANAFKITPRSSFSTWPRLPWSIFLQFAFCAIAKTRKSNYGIAPHTSWSGFAASALKVKSNDRIAENSAIAETLGVELRPKPVCCNTGWELDDHLQF
jgi:hypothetical protein